MGPVAVSGIWSFLSSIDWTDPWLLALLSFHGFLIVVTVITRHHGNLQACLFFTLLLLVYFSENINELAARHWRSFSKQQYFDSQGMFISLLFSIPLLINCLLMVCNWVWVSGTIMVKLKQAQLRERRRRCPAIVQADVPDRKLD